MCGKSSLVKAGENILSVPRSSDEKCSLVTSYTSRATTHGNCCLKSDNHCMSWYVQWLWMIE